MFFKIEFMIDINSQVFMVSDFVMFSLAIVNLKFEIENWLANWSPIVIKLHLEYEIPICHV